MITLEIDRFLSKKLMMIRLIWGILFVNMFFFLVGYYFDGDGIPKI